MTLPIVSVPKHSVTLPSGTKVTFRPFLTGEQKILLMAMEGQDKQSIISSVEELIDKCTFGKVDAKQLPGFDLEMLWLQLRCKSVGEIVDIRIACQHCNKPIDTNVNLEQFTTNGSVPKDRSIQLDDSVGVVIKFPTIETAAIIAQIDDFEADSLKVLISLTECIYDDKQTYKLSDSTPEEVETFFNQLTPEHMSKIQKFFEGLPKLILTKDVECPHCKSANHYKFEGIYDFFR